MDKLQTINFYDDEILVIRNADGKGYVVLKRLCENLGLDANGQKQRLQRDPKWCTCMIHPLRDKK